MLIPGLPQARPEVESLQAYSAPLEGRRGLLRLDFNENTVGPSPQVVEAIRAIPPISTPSIPSTTACGRLWLPISLQQSSASR